MREPPPCLSERRSAEAQCPHSIAAPRVYDPQASTTAGETHTMRQLFAILAMAALVVVASCQRLPAPIALRLVDPVEPTEWRFDNEGTALLSAPDEGGNEGAPPEDRSERGEHDSRRPRSPCGKD